MALFALMLLTDALLYSKKRYLALFANAIP
jgi:hypothetical protein